MKYNKLLAVEEYDEEVKKGNIVYNQITRGVIKKFEKEKEVKQKDKYEEQLKRFKQT